MYKDGYKKEHIIETDKVITTFITSLDKGKPITQISCHHKENRFIFFTCIQETPEEFAKKGGTKIHCPSCNKIRICEAIEPIWLTKSNGRRWYKINHSDISWFRRGRRCRTCFYQFLTAEVHEKLLDELVRLRDDIIAGKIISAEDLAQYGDNIIPFPKP